MKLNHDKVLKFILLTLLIPYGILITLYSALRGWDNGYYWWIGWYELCKGLPPTVSADDRGSFTTRK